MLSSTLWFVGFALMLGSFGFLFGRNDEPDYPRISVDPWWPDNTSGWRG
jgi:hypothetical protein